MASTCEKAVLEINIPEDIPLDDDIPRYSDEFFAERRAARHEKRDEGVLRSWLPPSVTSLRSWLVTLLVLLLFSPFVADLTLAAGRVHRGVYAGGIDLGGMTIPEARKVLDSKGGPLVARPVTLTYEGKRWEVTAKKVRAAVDTEGTIREAYSVGRRGSIGQRFSERARGWFQRVTLPLGVSIDRKAAGNAVCEAGAKVAVKSTDASVSIDGTAVSTLPAKDGLTVDVGPATQSLVEAFGSPSDRVVELPMVPARPSVSDANASGAAEAARKILSAPVTLVYGKRTWNVAADRIAEWVRFRAVPLSREASAQPGQEATAGVLPPMKLEAFLDPVAVGGTVAPLTKAVERPAKDASFKVSDGKVSIVPSQVGVGIDAAALADNLGTVLTGSGARSVELRVRTTQPKVTTEKARGMGIVERISTYTTTYDSSNRPRVNNIHLLADTIDGTLIAPGETFSFNKTVGPRTAQKGYQEANAIVNGKLVPQLGGGICQFGTTIFNTVFFSGLPVVERRNHSFYISHYPKGRDATVSWGGPDFKFKNDTGSWVLIDTAYTASSVTVSLYGTDPGYDVTYTTGPFTDVKPFPTEEVEDATLAEGVRVVEDPGVNGAKVVVTRTVKLGSKVVRQDTFVSLYKPKAQVVRVGTKAKAGAGGG